MAPERKRAAGPRVTRPAVWAGLLIGALAAVSAAAGPWWQLRIEASTATFSGAEATAGLAIILVGVGAAGILLLLATGPRGRQLTGGLLAVVGAGMVALGVRNQPPGPAEVEARLRTLSLATEYQLQPTLLPWGYALAAAIFTAAAIALIRYAPTWPDRSARYNAGETPAAASAADDPEAWWRAIDRGEDPTQPAPDFTSAPTGCENGDGEDTRRPG